MNAPEQVPARRGISMRMLAQQKDGARPVPTAARSGVVVRRLLDLHAAVGDHHRTLALRVAEVLTSQGFGPQHLDDMIYEIADHVCGTLTSPSACDNEYRAANELNTQSMADQLAILAVWFGGEEALKAKLAKDLLVAFAGQKSA